MKHIKIILGLCYLASLMAPNIFAKVPGVLPKPSDTPPASEKPVKVYILAGQSNMVGFGKLSGSAPYYPSIYLSADPSVIPSRLPVGSSALLPHGIYQGKDSQAPKGAIVEIYKGAFDPKTDYSQKEPSKTATVALGTASESLPSINGPHTLVVKAFIEVPMSGAFEAYPGFKESTHAIVKINNQEVYRKNVGESPTVTKTQLTSGTRTPITITYLKGGSAAFFLKHVDLKGQGDLTSLTKAGKYSWFIDEEGKWTTRKDVTYWEVRVSRGKDPEGFGKGGPLTVTSNGKFLGPEVPFGYVMGTYHDEPVLLIESSMGNRALSFDFRPPSSGRSDPDNNYEGLEYRMLVEGTHKALANIEKVVPGYKGQGYEIAGFAWFQGHKDAGKSKEEYEDHLSNLIQDLRKEFKAPNMKAVVATVAFDGPRLNEKYQAIHAAQMAVGNPKQHPKFKGNVASVDTLSFWREPGISPTGTNYHYNHNAETYALVGDALGRAMVKLIGGEADDITLPPTPPQHPNVEKIYSYEITSSRPTDDQVKTMNNALKPLFLEELIPSWVNSSFADPKFRFKGMKFSDALADKTPKRLPESAYSQVDAIGDYYKAIGISDYEWKNFTPEMKTSTWNYFSFDPPEKQPAEKSDRMRKMTFPKGMENWFEKDFDAKSAGWKNGKAPFGQCAGKLAPRKRVKGECDWPTLCGCQGKPNTLWEKEVLLMQQTFDLPTLKEGHAYRVILGGAGCDRSGESFAIYVNGKLLRSSKGGFYRNDGIRGAYIYKDMLPEFQKDKVTISVINFLRYTHFKNKTTWYNPEIEDAETVPANGQVSMWIQEAKLPEVVLKAQAAIKK